MVDFKKLYEISNKIRQDIIKSLLSAGSGHSAGPLGMADIFTLLYFEILKINPKKPLWKDRDYLVLSNGHICPVLYTTLAHRGYFPISELSSLRKYGSRLQGHPHRGSLPGIETTSGPLGSGLSQACGMSLALKKDKKDNLVYCLTSDGEHGEGNYWEAVLFAAHYNLDNLIVIIDRNKIQIDGNTEDVLKLDSLSKKYLAFNWEVSQCDGHDLKLLHKEINRLKKIKGKPKVIIALTTPGKGVSFMENDYTWHGKPPKLEEAKLALKELGGKL